MQVQSLHYYPVKALAGQSVSTWTLEPRGFRDDRRWMFVDERNNFMSQRKNPVFVHWSAAVEGDQLTISEIGGEGRVFVIDNARPTKAPDLPITLFEHAFPVAEVSSPVIVSLTEAMGIGGAKLVYMNEATHRKINPDYAREGEEVSLADGYPYLIVNSASLADFSDRVGQPLLMNRFRPNIVVSTDEAWVEDEWTGLSIGQQVFRLPKPCSRCRVITIDQETGEQDIRLLAQLAEFRKRDGKILFGVNAIWNPQEDGRISVGDSVRNVES